MVINKVRLKKIVGLLVLISLCIAALAYDVDAEVVSLPVDNQSGDVNFVKLQSINYNSENNWVQFIFSDVTSYLSVDNNDYILNAYAWDFNFTCSTMTDIKMNIQSDQLVVSGIWDKTSSPVITLTYRKHNLTDPLVMPKTIYYSRLIEFNQYTGVSTTTSASMPTLALLKSLTYYDDGVLMLVESTNNTTGTKTYTAYYCWSVRDKIWSKVTNESSYQISGETLSRSVYNGTSFSALTSVSKVTLINNSSQTDRVLYLSNNAYDYSTSPATLMMNKNVNYSNVVTVSEDIFSSTIEFGSLTSDTNTFIANVTVDSTICPARGNVEITSNLPPEMFTSTYTYTRQYEGHNTFNYSIKFRLSDNVPKAVTIKVKYAGKEIATKTATCTSTFTGDYEQFNPATKYTFKVEFNKANSYIETGSSGTADDYYCLKVDTNITCNMPNNGDLPKILVSGKLLDGSIVVLPVKLSTYDGLSPDKTEIRSCYHSLYIDITKTKIPQRNSAGEIYADKDNLKNVYITYQQMYAGKVNNMTILPVDYSSLLEMRVTREALEGKIFTPQDLAQIPVDVMERTWENFVDDATDWSDLSDYVPLYDGITDTDTDWKTKLSNLYKSNKLLFYALMATGAYLIFFYKK